MKSKSARIDFPQSCLVCSIYTKIYTVQWHFIQINLINWLCLDFCTPWHTRTKDIKTLPSFAVKSWCNQHWQAFGAELCMHVCCLANIILLLNNEMHMLEIDSIEKLADTDESLTYRIQFVQMLIVQVYFFLQIFML